MNRERLHGQRPRCLPAVFGDAVEQRRQCGEFAIEPRLQRMFVVCVEAVGSGEMLVAQRRPRILPIVTGGGRLREFGQRIGDALHRRNHHRSRLGRCLQQIGDMAIAVGIGDAAAAEFMRSIRCIRAIRGTVVGIAVVWCGRIHGETPLGAPQPFGSRALALRPWWGAGRRSKGLFRFAAAARTAGGTSTGVGGGRNYRDHRRHSARNAGAGSDDGGAAVHVIRCKRSVCGASNDFSGRGMTGFVEWCCKAGPRLPLWIFR